MLRLLLLLMMMMMTDGWGGKEQDELQLGPVVVET
jgi:hypothetical protein